MLSTSPPPPHPLTPPPFGLTLIGALQWGKEEEVISVLAQMDPDGEGIFDQHDIYPQYTA